MKRGGLEVITASCVFLSLTSDQLTSTHPLSLYIEFFTIYLARKLWEMSEWMHRVCCSPIPEESPPSDAGPVTDNLHFMALSAYNPTERSPLCRSAEEKLVSVENSWGILSTGSSQGRKGCPLAIWCTTLYSSSFHWSFNFLLPL